MIEKKMCGKEMSKACLDDTSIGHDDDEREVAVGEEP